MPKGQKLASAAVYEFVATVRRLNGADFPFHLLLKERACPAKEADSGKIDDLIYHQDDAQINLLTRRCTKTDPWLTEEWRKAGWELLPAGKYGEDFQKLPYAYRYRHRALISPQRGYRFPVDQLRYDRCWPATVKSAERILVPFGERAKHSVYVETFSEGAKPLWTPGRWESFGWSIKEVDAWEPSDEDAE